jgi:hypothetical protein
MPSFDLMNLLQGTGANRILRTVRFLPDVAQETSGQAGGQVRVRDLRSPLWRIRVSAPTIALPNKQDVVALIEAMGISIGTFYAWNPERRYPKADPSGTILGVSAPEIRTVGTNNKSLSLSGLPAGYVLSRGDMLAFDYGSPSSRALHRVVTPTVTADGDGETAEFEIAPHFRQGVEEGLGVTLVKASAEFCIIPGTYEPDADGLFGSISFEAIQVVNG